MTEVHAQPHGTHARSPVDGLHGLTRFDASHTFGDAPQERAPEPPNPELLAAAAGQSDAHASDQLRLQADQLAEQLQLRQRELERREAHLNSRLAQFENELRSSRLWIHEREQEFHEREEQLQQKMEELEERTTSLATAQLSAEKEAVAQLQAKQRRFEELSSILNNQLTQLRQDRDVLQTERRLAEQKAQDAGSAVAEEQERQRQELQTQQRAIERRSRALAKRRAAIERLHGDAAAMHRKSLEMQLMVKQLWAELAGASASAAMTKALTAIRNKLADQFRWENQTLNRQQRELRQLVARLDLRQRRLRRQRDELRQWYARRNKEFQQQAAGLAARQRELEQQHADMQRQRSDERIAHREQIQRLVNQLRLERDNAA